MPCWWRVQSQQQSGEKVVSLVCTSDTGSAGVRGVGRGAKAALPGDGDRAPMDAGGEGGAGHASARDRLLGIFAQKNKSFVIQQLVPEVRMKVGRGEFTQCHVRVAVLVVGNLDVFLQRLPKVYYKGGGGGGGGGMEGDATHGSAAWQVADLEEVARMMEGVEGEEEVRLLVEKWLSGFRSAVAR